MHFYFLPWSPCLHSGLREWRLDPELLALCLGSAIYPLSDLHQVLLSLCASLSTSATWERCYSCVGNDPQRTSGSEPPRAGRTPLKSIQMCVLQDLYKMGEGLTLSQEAIDSEWFLGGGRDIFFCRIATCFCEESFGPLVPVGNPD